MTCFSKGGEKSPSTSSKLTGISRRHCVNDSLSTATCWYRVWLTVPNLYTRSDPDGELGVAEGRRIHDLHVDARTDWTAIAVDLYLPFFFGI